MLVAKFLRSVERHRLFASGARVIAAVSGGADSVCLLHLLVAVRERRRLILEVAHFDHGLRGEASRRDAAFVRELAGRLGLDAHFGAAPAFTAAARRGRSLQELAREARLRFLLDLARSRHAIVALGHHADDQAETLLMRFLAGGGPAGLGGIPPASHGGALVHPLLDIRRAEIEAWLAARGEDYCTDRTNRSPRYLRNRVRLHLLPTLVRDYNPRLVEHLGTLAALLRRDQEYLDALARDTLARAVGSSREVHFPAGLLTETHPVILARAVLAALRRLAPAEKPFSSRHVEAVLGAGGGSRRWDLPGGVRALRDPTGLTLARGRRRRPAPRPLVPTPLPIPGTVPLPGAGGSLSARVRRRPAAWDPRSIAGNPRCAVLDRGKIHPPLLIRGRRPGDRFHPLGLPGEKKLKEVLIDAKVPAAARDALPLVCDRDGIVWVAGIRPDERGRVTDGTRRLLVLEWEPAAAPRSR